MQPSNSVTQQLHPARRLAGIEISLIRQINALATPLSVNLGIGEPNVEPDETLREFAVRAAATGSWHYTANAGTLKLRTLIAEGIRESGVGSRSSVTIGNENAPTPDPRPPTPDSHEFDPKTEVCVTAGTEEALFSIFQAFVDPGDEVLVPNPGFLSYVTLARIAGATPVSYEFDPSDWRLDADALLGRITARTKLIIVNSPSNPLGSVIDRETLQRIANAGPIVVSDEVYREIWYEEPPPSMLGMSDSVIVVGGMSKSHAMTGLRLGWVLARESVMKPIVTAHQYVATCASAFSQSLAESILSDAARNRSWLKGIRAQFGAQRRAALFSIARELEVTIPPPAGAFYAFVPVPSCDTVTFAKTLATDAAVLVIPGVAFGSLGEGFVRISYAASIEAITAGIERIGRWLRAARR
ncbi:MAG TPA: pyridoxal phosphate-dependent aminotransferase [Thermoanaerobaculia bacterium]|jgi:aminotransferase|nr:pyridoxal phosphate-dependent aminotransferase [Thermoanaerobaculia bacterium]